MLYEVITLSVIYLIENNAYMTASENPPIDYNAPLETVLGNLKTTFFGGEISTTVYKTLEF